MSEDCATLRLNRSAMALWVFVVISTTVRAADVEHDRLLAELDFTGGMVVICGCDDARLPALLAGDGSDLVHVLATNRGSVQLLRRTFAERGLAGRVTVSVFSGETLPFAGNTVNLLIVPSGAQAAERMGAEEMQRVLAPGGELCVKSNSEWNITVKLA